MTTAKLLELGGVAALLGGVLEAVHNFVILAEIAKEPEGFMSASRYYLHGGLALVIGALVMFGLVGLYASQARQAGIFGAVGFTLAFVGTALAYGVAWHAAFSLPSLVYASPELVTRPEALPGPYETGITLAFLALAVGWGAFAASTLLAGVYPRAAAALLAAGAAFYVCPEPPLAYIGVIVEHVDLGCLLPLSHRAVTVGNIAWAAALAWLGLLLLTRTAPKPEAGPPEAA